MSFALHGVGVSRGIVIGRVQVLQRDQLEISEYGITAEQVNGEILRLNGVNSKRTQTRYGKK